MLELRFRETGKDNPALARALLSFLSSGDEAMEELGSAKIAIETARARVTPGLAGKTAIFAWLHDEDKDTVLRYTGAPGHTEVLGTEGRIAFFAALPGEVKFAALVRCFEGLEQLRTYAQAARAQAEEVDPDVANAEVPRSELYKAFWSQAVPMIGFGFADNFLMICLGETIEFQFGLYVSTMAAAGLGNLMSNLIGLGLADWIESISDRLGIQTPRLTGEQRQQKSVRGISLLGVMFGTTIGCIVGMAPLLFVVHR